MYRKFERLEEFIQAIFAPIDMARMVLQVGDPDINLKNSKKKKTIKNMLRENLHYVFPDSVFQVGPEVEMQFNDFEPKFVGQLGDFWFVGINVLPALSAPVFIALYIDDSDNLCYYIPSVGNTFNVIVGKPFGKDDTDNASCKALCGCTIEELALKPEKYQNIDVMKGEICEFFGIGNYSILLKEDINQSMENMFAFTKNKKDTEELL